MPSQKSKKTKTNSRPRLIKKSKLPATKAVPKTVPAKKISSVKLIKKSYSLIINNWKLFWVLIIIYLLVSILLVRGLNSSSVIDNLKSSLHIGSTASTTASASVLSSLSGTTQTTNSSGSAQPILLLIFSVILIWSIRETINKHLITARDAIYKSLYPLISFSLVIILLAIELFPLIIGSFIFGVVFGNDIANNLIERAIFALISLGLIYLSLFLVVSTILSLYIVTLPGMRPMQAIKSSWRLAKYKRVDIFIKILIVIVGLLLLNVIITIPFIFIATSLASWVFFVLSVISVLFFHTYMFFFYREMI